MEKEKKINKMGEKNVNSLMLSMGIPMIISMVLQAVYNIVDSAFISNMPTNGEEALNALTLAFPVQMLMVAVGIGTGVGANALLSRSLGQGDSEKVNKTSGNGAFLGAVIYVVFLIFGLVGVKPYISTQTQNPIVRDMAVDYLTICCVFSVGIVFFALYEKLLQSTGRSIFATIAQIAGAVTNIVLDPIMIYGWFGCPTLGVAGAGYATVIGQIVSMITAFVFHLLFNKEIKNSIKYLKPSATTIKQIYAIGLPAIIAQALMSFMTYGLNVILVSLGESYVTAYGLYYKIQQFILFAAFGIRDAVTPIVSFNYGMGSKKRVLQGVRCGLIYTTVIMLAGIIALELFATPISGMFGLSGNTQSICIDTMRIISISFVFAGGNIALQGVFQGINCGLASLIISVLRQLLLVLPVVYVFTLLVKADILPDFIVWFTFIIAEGLSFLTSVMLYKRAYRREISTLR
ncbi:MAG: MATE family efflux transporter [Ruminococcus sp.]